MKKILILLLTISLFLACSNSPKETGLKGVVGDAYYVGAAISGAALMDKEPLTFPLVKKEYNTITAENDMKWERIHPKPDSFHFELADKFVNFGVENDMFVIGHTLCWHSQTPRWVFKNENGDDKTKEELLAELKNHIETVAGRYKGKVNGWDVVNEAVTEQGLRNSPWMRICGPEYIQKAFEWAHAVDPDAELYYNDYSMVDSSKRAHVIEMVKDLQAKGAPIHGIGMQAHWQIDGPSIEEIEKSILAYSELGLKVMLTELDIDVLPSIWGRVGGDLSRRFEADDELNPYKEGLPDSVQQKLAQRYADIFTLCEKHKDKISRVTFWGVSDANTWLHNFPVRGRTNYPLLFDHNYEPKPAYTKVIETIKSLR